MEGRGRGAPEGWQATPIGPCRHAWPATCPSGQRQTVQGTGPTYYLDGRGRQEGRPHFSRGPHGRRGGVVRRRRQIKMSPRRRSAGYTDRRAIVASAEQASRDLGNDMSNIPVKLIYVKFIDEIRTCTGP